MAQLALAPQPIPINISCFWFGDRPRSEKSAQVPVGELKQPCNLSRVVAFSRHAMSLVYVLVLGQVLIEKFFCAGPEAF